MLRIENILMSRYFLSSLVQPA